MVVQFPRVKRGELLPLVTVPVPVRLLPVEAPALETRVLARVIIDGVTCTVIGRASDLPATLEWLDDLEGKRSIL
ncbi:hypothetical protein DAERI_010046 [Deinococcus aerius]|uniref:Uncharacterized protein n=1 Tax=Deinococcus aerius TaxID=200253 RepID=A0A2I9CR02_9DEIO|nr:hypothetical protein [Deinococcus aerius]GBF03874.1 hypothetical protein DAERI_010046 [Deinococcus aerius]